MVTELFSCEIEFAYYIWSWTQKRLDAETNCRLQSKLILDSAFKGLCRLQGSCLLVLKNIAVVSVSGLMESQVSQETCGITDVTESGN